MVDAPDGDLTPRAAWQLLSADAEAVLVDVRTRAEWSYVGVPDLTPLGRSVVLLEWVGYPDSEPNPAFLDELAAAAGPGAPVAFICRSGVRSKAAAQAAAEAGYTRVFNVVEGFEGPLDSDQHRGTGTGWKAAGLPWRQS